MFLIYFDTAMKVFLQIFSCFLLTISRFTTSWFWTLFWALRWLLLCANWEFWRIRSFWRVTKGIFVFIYVCVFVIFCVFLFHIFVWVVYWFCVLTIQVKLNLLLFFKLLLVLFIITCHFQYLTIISTTFTYFHSHL